jgi:hypothetical protein
VSACHFGTINSLFFCGEIVQPACAVVPHGGPAALYKEHRRRRSSTGRWARRRRSSTGRWARRCRSSTGRWARRCRSSTGRWARRSRSSTGRWARRRRSSTGRWARRSRSSTGRWARRRRSSTGRWRGGDFGGVGGVAHGARRQVGRSSHQLAADRTRGVSGWDLVGSHGRWKRPCLQINSPHDHIIWRVELVDSHEGGKVLASKPPPYNLNIIPFAARLGA